MERATSLLPLSAGLLLIGLCIVLLWQLTSSAPILGAADDTTRAGMRPATVLELMAGNESLSLFAEFARHSALEPALTGAARVTVFAPSNEAFSKLTDAERTELMSSMLAQDDLVAEHVLVGRVVGASDLVPQRVETAGGTSTEISLRGGVRQFGDAKLATRSYIADNGVVHVVDRVSAHQVDVRSDRLLVSVGADS